MGIYFYLGNAFPRLSLRAKPDISFEELKVMFEINLSKADLKKVKIFRTYIDITNLRLLWLGKEIDPHGNYNERELEDNILTKTNLPYFVFEFLDRYENKEDRLKYFSFLTVNFLNRVIKKNKGFLNFYFDFEKKSRLILTALRAKKLKRDISFELQFEDLTDDFVAYILSQKDSDNIEPPKEYLQIKNIYIKNINEPNKMLYELLEYKFNLIEEFSKDKPFTIDQILSYAALLMIAEDFNKLSIDEGKQIIEKL
ncbi:MAG: DUF2764 family protein [Parachlamydiales bacterium]|jgi:uncharacterized protein YihD (DUF1040 family)